MAWEVLLTSTVFCVSLSDCSQAVVAEAEMRLAEIQKATYEFDREIVRGSVSPVSCSDLWNLSSIIFITIIQTQCMYQQHINCGV